MSLAHLKSSRIKPDLRIVTIKSEFEMRVEARNWFTVADLPHRATTVHDLPAVNWLPLWEGPLYFLIEANSKGVASRREWYLNKAKSRTIHVGYTKASEATSQEFRGNVSMRSGFRNEWQPMSITIRVAR